MNVLVVFVDFKIIYGSKGEPILVSPEDYDYLNQFKWNCHDGYARTFRRRKEDGFKLRGEFLHRMVMNIPKDKDVDHIYHTL